MQNFWCTLSDEVQLALAQSALQRAAETIAEQAEALAGVIETGELSEVEIKAGIRERTIKGEIVPMLCGSAFKNKGVQAMLDAVVEYMPAPTDIPPVRGMDENEEPITRKADDGEKFAALAFKLMTDPFVGQLTFVRVYSGVLSKGARQERSYRPDCTDARQQSRRNR